MKSTVNEEFEFAWRGTSQKITRAPGAEQWLIRRWHEKIDMRKKLSPIREVAVKLAKTWLDALEHGKLDVLDALRQRTQYPSLGQIGKIYLSRYSALEIAEYTAITNYAGLLLCVADVLGISKEAAMSESASVLTADFIGQFHETAAKKLSIHTIHSRLTQARSVFSKRALTLYTDLTLPDLSGFMKTPGGKRRRTADQTWVPFEPGVEEKLERESLKLRAENLDLYLVFLLAARLGLRNKEIESVRGTWFEVHGDTIRIAVIDRASEAFRTKGGVNRRITVPAELEPHCRKAMESPDAFLIYPDGKPSMRHVKINNEFNRWIKQFIPKCDKGLYQLRKWAGSRVATVLSIYAAKEFLGHSTVMTTEKHYARFLQELHGLGSSTVPAIISPPPVAHSPSPETP